MDMFLREGAAEGAFLEETRKHLAKNPRNRPDINQDLCPSSRQ
jgi:hypothetical protein